jgi:orotate phosphoribosyltransferase
MDSKPIAARLESSSLSSGTCLTVRIPYDTVRPRKEDALMHILKAPFEDLLDESETKALVADLIRCGFLRWVPHEVEFRGGMKSKVLVGGREDLTQHPRTLHKIGNLIAKAAFRVAPEYSKLCLIGVPMVGNTLATAASIASERYLPFLNMRQVKKSHGAHRTWVDGEPYAFGHYVTIDNTITDGGSKTETVERLSEDGFLVKYEVSHLVLVDRGIGGPEHLHALGYKIFSIFDLPTLVRAFVECGEWPQERLDCILLENSRYKLM